MNFRLKIVIVYLTVACNPRTDDWQTLDFGLFKLKTPFGWIKVEKQVVDSYVGGLTNGKDTLWFDYGLYSVNLAKEESLVHRYAKDTVNGLFATITIPNTEGKGLISMYIPTVTDSNKFTIWGNNIFETDLTLKIFKSVTFKNSDTSKNPALTAGKFISKSDQRGKKLFQSNCAVCHGIFKDFNGPPLYDIMKRRSAEWVYLFLTDRSKVKSDSMDKALRAKYAIRCMNFSALPKKDIESIVEYLRD